MRDVVQMSQRVRIIWRLRVVGMVAGVTTASSRVRPPRLPISSGQIHTTNVSRMGFRLPDWLAVRLAGPGV